jgi:hypothetical protein
MDVHQATISVAVMDAAGKLIMECLLETKASTIVEFIQGLQETLSLTFEEGTSAAWLHDLLKAHVSRLVVCDPRKAALLKEGNKSDRTDAQSWPSCYARTSSRRVGEVIYVKDETGKVSHFVVRTGLGDLVAKKIK